MRHYTNKTNMPEHIFRAICRADSKYSKGDADFSVTGLLRPAHMAALEREHADENETDAADAIFRVWGTVAHDILADGHDGAQQETRFYADFDGVRVSGQIDILTHDDDGRLVIIDTKTTSAAAVQSGDVPMQCATSGRTYYGKPEWVQQLNMYRLLVIRNAEKPADIAEAENASLRVSVLFRDWSQFRAGSDGYPHAPALDLIVPTWTVAEAEAFVSARIAAHKSPPDVCSESERWETGPAFRVVGPNAPDKNFRSIETATKAVISADKKGGAHMIEEHAGTPKRCAGYCSVSRFCQFWIARGGK